MTSTEDRLRYADRVARIWVDRYRVPPVTGRIAGYLLVCVPQSQSIDEIAAALRASRSAVAGGVKDLASRGLLQRSRAAGERVDRVRMVFDPTRGFGPEPYQEMAAMAREGIEVLGDHSDERCDDLEQMASLGEFLAERLPTLLDEWRSTRRRTVLGADAVRGSR